MESNVPIRRFLVPSNGIVEVDISLSAWKILQVYMRKIDLKIFWGAGLA
jgi:hypothetical protein